MSDGRDEPEASEGAGPDAVDVTPPRATADEPGARPWWGEPWSEDAPPNGSSTPNDPYPRPGVGAFAAPAAAPPPPRHRFRTPLLVTAVALGMVLFTGIGAAIGVAVGDDHDSASGAGAINRSGKVATAPAVDSNGTTNVESVAASVLPTVVSISERTARLEGTGSGVIIDAPQGLVLTNNHVVSAAAGGNGKITVTTNDGRTAIATVRGRDPSSDIAVIQVKLDNLTQARLGDSSTLKVGQTVVAFGSPLGLKGSVTSGIVSALDRPVSTQDSADQSPSGTQATIDAIQTDAAINPGNSGGPLVDGMGQVIGINSAIATTGGDSGGTESGSIGVGFAIPINEALNTAEQIIRTGHAVHPVISASITDPTDGSPGALVHDVTAGGPAAAAGLRTGDVITAVDGKAVDSPDATIVALRKGHNPGDKVTLTYLRNGAKHTATVVLGASEPSP